MQGKIIKGISGFYYVHITGSGVYECKAKGIFRNRKVKPLVGDVVRVDILDEAEKEGNIAEILPRKNTLIRPAVANIDQAILIFAAAEPKPDWSLLDRLLVVMRYQQIPAAICFNKADLLEEEQKREMASVYGGCGCPVIFTSAREGSGLKGLFGLAKGKTNAVAGPSGVGKSSLTNLLQQEVCMETGELSKKIKRGKNTTRHAQLIHVAGDTYIMDTPGFSALDIPGLTKEELWKYYPEFQSYEPQCRFQGCSHIHEPDCGVKQALAAGEIPARRYENYVSLYESLSEIKPYGK